MVLAMHAGFAFLEVGTVRLKNQVNALSKILSDFAISALAYFFVGYWIAYGVTFFHPAAALTVDSGYALVKFFFLLTFAAAIPAIISGGIAERARFGLQLCATALIVAFVYPFFEGLVWNGNFGLQEWLKLEFGAPFHDFAGSVVVHALGGWLALAAVLLLGSRNGRYRDGKLVAMAPSSIPFLALGSWILIIRLVRLQRDERPDPRRGQRAGGGQLLAGDGWRHHGVAADRPQRPGFPAQRSAGRVGGGVRRFRT